MNPSQYGAILARTDGDTIELLEIQPVREHCSDAEAREVGFPFWSKEASYDLDDLDASKPEAQAALIYCGTDLDEVPPESRLLVIAEALFAYGHKVEESRCGWARDVLPKGLGRVKWWGAEHPRGVSYIADEDVEFRREVLR